MLLGSWPFAVQRCFTSTSRLGVTRAACFRQTTRLCYSRCCAYTASGHHQGFCARSSRQLSGCSKRRSLAAQASAITRRVVNIQGSMTARQHSTMEAQTSSGSKQHQSVYQDSKPSLNHPSMIPLSLQGDKIAAASGTGPTVLEKLRDGMSLNQRESADGALVFGCTSTQGPASLIDSTIGSLRFRRYLACARNKLWWMTPEWGTSLNVLPQETQFLLLELEDAVSYAVVLPLIDGDFRGTLRPNR
eukprot:jgi/Chrzof1/8634/Cz03g18110.t1